MVLVDASIIITEIMINPTQVRDTVGEWFELYNTSPTTSVDLKDWSFRDNGRRDKFTVTTSLIVPPRSYVVFGKSNSSGSNGGIPTVNYVYSNTDMKFRRRDALIMLNANGVRVDTVDWSSRSTTFPRGEAGKSMALQRPTLDNTIGTNWCASSVKTYGDGDFGTPGTANDCPNVPPEPVPPPIPPPVPIAPKAPVTAPVVAPVAPVVPPAAAPMVLAPSSRPPGQVYIHMIQGSGVNVTTTNATTAIVNVTAIATSLFYRNDTLDGFFIQEEDIDADGNPATSEGIFVFCRGKCTPDTVFPGDRVNVIGIPNEFQGTSQIDTRGTTSSYTILSKNNSLPTPIELTLPSPNSTRVEASYEHLEGMLVRIPTTLVVSEYFELARFGQLVLTETSRPITYTQTNFPNITGFTAYREALERRIIVLDDDNSDSNDAITGGPDEAYYYPTGGLSNANKFRGGDTITGLTGVMQYAFGAWRIRPIPQRYNYTFVSSSTATPLLPRNITGRLRVSSFNVLNYFTSIDNGTLYCGPTGGFECRGANSQSELARQRTKIVAALDFINADIFGVIELENASNDIPLADLVTALNIAKNASIYTFIPTGAIGTDAIRVGLIYKNTTVTPFRSYRLLNSTVDPLFNDTKSRPTLIQTFTEISTGAKVTIAVNHFKSKGTACTDVNDPDINDGQGNCAVTRRNAAQALVRFLFSDPTNSSDADFLIIGDLNSYAREDSIRTLINNSFVDLIDRFGGVNRSYSYLFDGQLGYLDHAFASTPLVNQVTGATEWHINADEIPLFDYNDAILDPGEQSFERESNTTDLYMPDARRSSDHDPVIIGLNLTV